MDMYLMAFWIQSRNMDPDAGLKTKQSNSLIAQTLFSSTKEA